MTKHYRLLNNVIGWAAFAIAAFTYLSTVEPTASFWDCPEFISCAVKGEVGHPPGNAFFNLTGRFFANFAGGDMTQVGLWINRMSALLSAGTILFLFWTLTAMTRRLVCGYSDSMSVWQMVAIFASGIVGALAYTWSDTFWFSAVEAEVYAFSSFMTALVFWLILKWERSDAGVEADRYILLISYIIGLSIGVHLLNLLCIPAIVLVYYFKQYRHATALKTVGALLLSFVLVAVILYGIIPGVTRVAGWVELLFVNALGMPYNSGTAVFFLSVMALLVVSLWKVSRGVWFRRFSARLVGNIILCLLFILVGYSTFAHVMIRASAHLPMNENCPDEVFALSRYLGREQYGDTPLLFGQTFASSLARNDDGSAKVEDGAPVYTKVVKSSADEPDRYEMTGRKDRLIYDYEMFFPRMYSSMPSHIQGYKDWSNFKGKEVYVDGKTMTVPTFAENLRYFFRYQVGFMYWRYFMWNFSGRQNDLQGHGSIDKGNWITGITFIDELLVGDQHLPAFIAENKGHNVFYMLPLLLGIIGALWQLGRGKRGSESFLIVFMLFFMTGLAIVLYINQTPYQPRERDYAYVGSFYAFAIWIGMGVAALVDMANRVVKRHRTAVALVVSVACLCVPLQMVSQTWDDHDRSGRYTARDFGRNYLSSLDENAIILTDGDNETFPLWYAQDVEGYRTDVRVCNLSYLQTDWYINQMKAPSYSSSPLPIAFRPDQYNASKLEVAQIVELVDEELPLDTAMSFLYTDDPQYKQLPGYGRVDYIPTGKLRLDVDTTQSKGYCNAMHIDLSSRRYITKESIALLSMLEQINKDGWKRPIYISATTGRDRIPNLDAYKRLCGLVYQIVPMKGGGLSTCDIDKAYDNMMHKFLWGNIKSPDVYLDETSRRMCLTHRRMFTILIDNLIKAGDLDRALEATKYCDENIPSDKIPHDDMSIPLAESYLTCGEPALGEGILRSVIANSTDYLDWAFRLNNRQMRTIYGDVHDHIVTIHRALRLADSYGMSALMGENVGKLNAYIDNFNKLDGHE